MEPEAGELQQPASLFRLFTKESLVRIERRVAEEKAAKEASKEEDKKESSKVEDRDNEEEKEEEKPIPNPLFEAGKQLPTKLGEFPPELYGKPIEDLDEYYQNKFTFMVVAKDKTIFRFSATNALFILTPFNPIRRGAICILTHPAFSLFIMLVIVINCVFMAINQEIPKSEEIFTAIYTCEGTVKILARGFVLTHFTYLRDAWNWLDFTVVSLAYITMAVDLGNLAALRTFRVLRALKTVAVVPGLKTIVGALMEAVRRLRDVMILTVFVLSIFALVGLQIYQGVLKQKCVLELPHELQNASEGNKTAFQEDKRNWFKENGKPKLCGSGFEAGPCPEHYTCIIVGENPNYGYTNFDNFGWAMLCAFRLMTQDYWENLYQLVIRAAGPWHMLFFVLVIFMGSFYLVNLILAIVAMSYDEQQKQDQADEEEEALEEERAAEKALEEEREQEGYYYEDEDDASLSLPGSPFQLRRGSKQSQFSWRKNPKQAVVRGGDRQPLVLPYLDNLNLPYADDSAAVTPTSDELCNSQNTQSFLGGHRRRLSSTSYASRMSHPAYMDAATANGKFHPGSRRSSFASCHSRHSFTSHGDHSFKNRDRNREPTHFHWNTSIKSRAAHHLLPEVIVDKTKSDDNESSSSGSDECENAKGKLFPDNPFICRTPSATMVDMKDVLVLKDLIDHASGKRRSFMSDDGMTKKEFIKAKCMQFLFGWECSPCWHKFSHIVDLFVMDAFVDLFITLCIVVNTMFMAIDHYGMNESLERTLVNGNYVFTTIFTLEAALKVIALNPINYLKDRWNCFDIVIVFLSLVELGLANVKGLSILRSFRLLRVFKLAKSWPTLNLLIGIIGRTLGALGNLTFVLIIIVFIFAVMGMQLFGEKYNINMDRFLDGTLPRWNFTDFLHSFMIVFRVLCGEWIESMWDCMVVAGYVCVPFFLLTMVIGNLVVLNLFLALLLSSFGAGSLQQSQDDSEPNKLQEAIDRINRFIVFVKSHVLYCVKVKLKRKELDDFDPSLTKTELSSKEIMVDGEIPMRNGRICEHDSPDGDDDSQQERKEPNDTDEPMRKDSDAPTRPASMASLSTAKLSKSPSGDSHSSRSSSSYDGKSSLKSPMSDMDKGSQVTSVLSGSLDDVESMGNKTIDLDGPEINEVNVVFVRYPDECWPMACNRMSPCCGTCEKTCFGQCFWAFRCYMFKLVEHSYFENFIIIMIIASSLALAIEDIYLYQRPTLKLILKIMDKIFTIIFVLEMFIKMTAFGFKKYFTDAWCWLDFTIVAISLISLGAEGAGYDDIGAFKALRTLRALRPLRAVSRWEGMKVVVNALIQAIPSIFNVLLVCLVFWLIFSIMGVQLFGGRYHKCIDAEGNKINDSIVSGKNQCQEMEQEFNYTWVNSKINFDNVLMAYLALFQVATFKGWTDIMNDAIDSKEVDQQPSREVRVGMYLYFVFFIVFGSFFTLNLFIGVIIDNFNMQKKKGGSLEMFMTEDQKKYYNAMKKLGSKAPQKPIPKPRFKCQLFFFYLTTNQLFDVGIMIVIMLNMLTMAMEHYGQSKEFEETLNYVNQVFIAIFTLECIMKILGLRWYYFKQPWNVFDFVVVVLSVLGLAMADFITEYFVSPTLLRVVRVFRVGRVLRLVKSAKGIRTLLFSLAVSLPALFNIGLLLFLVMFIYAIFGMSFFMHVKHTAGIDDMFNFETFGRSMIILFQISTSAGWDGVLMGLMNDQPPECNKTKTPEKPGGDCGSSGMAIMYLVTYLVISFLVVINMYIAVILENFSQATEDVQQGLTQDDFDMYYEIWEKYDEEATEYIDISQLSEFVSVLEEPLRLPQPNHFRLVFLDITICKGDRVHCVDILDALTKNFLGTAGEAANELGDIKKGPDRHDYEPISSTMRRTREHYCAKVIQQAWRKYKNLEYIPPNSEKTEKGEGDDNKPMEPGDKPPRPDAHTCVKIEEEDEEQGSEDQTEDTDADEKGGPNHTKSRDKKTEGESDDHRPSGENTRTVELYPESGVVA